MSLARRLRRKQVNTVLDWVGGVVPASGAVDDLGAATALWIQDGQVLGQCAAPDPNLHGWDSPEGAGIVLIQLLLEIAETKTGPAPLRVRVEPPELARLMHRLIPPQVAVVCGPTPEINKWSESFRPSKVPSIRDALDFSELPSWERLATEIFEIKPWFFVAPLTVFHLRAPALGLDDAALTFLAERNGHSSVYVFSRRADLEDALCSGVAGAFDALACVELAFERAPGLHDEERKALTAAGWWFPDDDLAMRPLVRYQQGKPAFRALTERELEILQVGMFALRSMFSETVHGVDVTRSGVAGSWTVKLSGERAAHVSLSWPRRSHQRIGVLPAGEHGPIYSTPGQDPAATGAVAPAMNESLTTLALRLQQAAWPSDDRHLPDAQNSERHTGRGGRLSRSVRLAVCRAGAPLSRTRKKKTRSTR